MSSNNPPPAFPGMRIGLMGGSFNPAHGGHRHVAAEALKRLRLNCVWWIVTPGNPLKESAGQAAFSERAASARQAAAHPRIIVTEFESKLPAAYTVETIAYLKRRFPATHFVWIMGGDNLAGFHRWEGWRRIFGLTPIAVFDRPGFRRAAMASPAAVSFAAARLAESCAPHLPGFITPAWIYIGIPLSSLSSTAIRAGSQWPTAARKK